MLFPVSSGERQIRKSEVLLSRLSRFKAFLISFSLQNVFILSSFNGDTNDLELGDEVEYTLARKSSKVSAENIRKLARGTIPADVS